MSNENSVRLDLFDLLAASRTRHDRFANEARRVDSAEIYSLLNSHPGQTSDVIAEIDSIRMGLHACDIARDMLLLGDVERREHWLSVAADSGIEEAGWQQDEWDADALHPNHNTDIDADSGERVGEDMLLQALIRAKDAAEAALEDKKRGSRRSSPPRRWAWRSVTSMAGWFVQTGRWQRSWGTVEVR